MKRLSIMCLMLPSIAFAHTGDVGHAAHWAGFTHPFTGVDHMYAMFALGLWAAVSGGQRVWLFPLVFMGALLLGGALGVSGVAMPWVEPTIMASILLLGIVVALAWAPPLWLSLGGIALFGAAHGFAHGAEGPASGFALYALGFVAASGVLHLMGVGVGMVLGRGKTRALGLVAGAAAFAIAAV